MEGLDMYRNLTIGTRLLFGLGIMLGVSMFLSCAWIIQNRGLTKELEYAVNVTARRQQLAGQIGTAAAQMLAAENGKVLGSILQRNEVVSQSKRQFGEQLARMEKALAEFRPLCDATTLASVNALAGMLASVIRADDLMMQSLDKQQFDSGGKTFEESVQPRLREISEQTETLIRQENDRLAGAAELAQARSTRAYWTIALSLLLGITLAMSAGYILIQAIKRPLACLIAAMEPMRAGDFSRKETLELCGEFGVLAGGLDLMANSLSSLIQRVQKSGLQVNTSATEIAATAQEQLSTASQIAATTSEIGATSKEISATSKELVETIKDIAEVAEKTAVLAGSGQSGLARMQTIMQQVNEASASISARLGTLSEKAGNIGTVVTTITKVADQTNLLSLNAAIEAEKAGDYGRGFAVVATEIRRLADQTAGATSDIEQMVKEMQSAVAAGVMGMDKFSEEVRRGVEAVEQVSKELSQIIQHVQTLPPNFETVSEGMQSQSLGAQQISDSLSQLGEASQQTVASLRQSNSAIAQLNEASIGLQDSVASFTVRT
jgi:methyl-accepting chemotaxis protein WspA